MRCPKDVICRHDEMTRTEIGKKVERLIDNGYGDPRALSQQTGLSVRQCNRYLRKFKLEAKVRFDNLMSEDYLYLYYNTLDNFSKTIQQCNEELGNTKEKYDDLEEQVDGALEKLDEKQGITRSALLGQLIQIQNSRENAIIRLTAQRDKASDLKAKVYNAGPVVAALDQWVRDNTPKGGELKGLNMSMENIKTSTSVEDEKSEISEEDAKVIKEMEEENESN